MFVSFNLSCSLIIYKMDVPQWRVPSRKSSKDQLADHEVYMESRYLGNVLLPWKTHNILVHVAGGSGLIMVGQTRCITYIMIKMCFMSDIHVAMTISNMGRYNSYSIMGANIECFNNKLINIICIGLRFTYAKTMKMSSKS